MVSAPLSFFFVVMDPKELYDDNTLKFVIEVINDNTQ